MGRLKKFLSWPTPEPWWPPNERPLIQRQAIGLVKAWVVLASLASIATALALIWDWCTTGRITTN